MVEDNVVRREAGKEKSGREYRREDEREMAVL